MFLSWLPRILLFALLEPLLIQSHLYIVLMTICITQCKVQAQQSKQENIKLLMVLSYSVGITCTDQSLVIGFLFRLQKKHWAGFWFQPDEQWVFHDTARLDVCTEFAIRSRETGLGKIRPRAIVSVDFLHSSSSIIQSIKWCRTWLLYVTYI